MAFQTSNGFNNQNNSQGDKKKSNFPVGRLFGSDAKMNMSIWNSDSAVFTIIAIAQSVGKDPSTGGNVYEQKAPNELPRIFLKPQDLAALLSVTKTLDINGSGTYPFAQKNGSKLTISVSNAKVTITTETTKNGSRTITFDPEPFGSINVNGNWRLFTNYLEIAYKKALFAKLDQEEFGMAVAAAESAENEVPI